LILLIGVVSKNHGSIESLTGLYKVFFSGALYRFYLLVLDLNLVRHILIQQNDDDNTPFLTYLTKKQKEES